MHRFATTVFSIAASCILLAACAGSDPADIALVTGGVVENLGENVNSAWDDYAPAVTANGTLFFTSRRPNPKRQDYMDDVYRVNHTNKNEWEKPEYLSDVINSPESQGAIAISPDGRTLYLALCQQPDGYGKCDIYIAEWNERGTEWTKARNLDNPEGTDLRMTKIVDDFNKINTTYWESQPSISPDGQTLYFASDRPGGYGGTDLWMSKKQLDGTWGRPVNLGPDVNTKGEERTPSISFDGRTLYYASDGYPDGENSKAAGGMDLYVTRAQGSRWSRPMNLGYPINSKNDDVFVSSTLSTDTLYFASNRPGGYGGFDLYLLLDPPFPPDAVVNIVGVVTDIETGRPLASTPITIEDYGTGEVVNKFQSLESGQYQFIVPAGREYRISAEQKGYLFKSDVFEVAELTLNRRVERNIALEPIPPIVTVPPKTNLTVLFDFDKATLRPESTPELQRAIRFIFQNPGRKFEIGAHTDALGTEEYNLDLSERRAAAVRKYLIEKGVPEDIISSKGFGESQPIDDNETPQGRQRNRRVELSVVE